MFLDRIKEVFSSLKDGGETGPEAWSRPSARLAAKLAQKADQHPSHAVRLNVKILLGEDLYPEAYAGLKPQKPDLDREQRAEMRGNNISAADLLSLRPAKTTEYAAFLIKHLSSGGKITRVEERPFNEYPLNDAILTATRSMNIPKACGAAALDVLVPAGITVNRLGSLDHGQSYNMVDGTVTGAQRVSVSIYPDVAAAMIRMGWKPSMSDLADSLYGPRASDALVHTMGGKIYAAGSGGNPTI